MNSDFRILFVDQTGQLGGAELCLADLATHLRDQSTVLLFEAGPFQELLEKNGVHATVLTGGRKKAQVRKNSKISTYVQALPGFIRLLVKVARVAQGFDVLYANTAKALIITAVAASILRKPFLFHLHDIIDAQHFSRLNRWLLVTAANRATGIVANSEATAEAYRNAGGNSRNLVVVPNGFHLERFRADVELLSREIRASIGIGDRPLVGLFGRITPWKCQKVLLQALSQIPEVHAVIVGDALFTDEDQEYKRALVDLAERLGVAHRVHLTGFQSDILPFLKAVDLVVHCSVSPEPFGRVIVEAQLAGRPVIASRCGGPAEIIEDGVTGILVNPGDSGELVSAIQRLLNNRRWAETLARSGRDAAAQRFDLERILAEWTDFINRSVEGLTRSGVKTATGVARRRSRETDVKLTEA